MPTVTLEQLKDTLDEQIGLVARGETVLVTDHDRVVAEPTPPRQRDAPDLPPPLAELVRQGLARPATLPRGTRPRQHRVAKLADLLAELDEDRSDR